MKMAKNLLALAAVIVLTGCASVTYDEMVQRAAGVNRDDGISKAEAVWLAQDYLIQQEMQDQFDVGHPKRVGSGVAWEKAGQRMHFAVPPTNDSDFEKGRFWSVNFSPKRKSAWWQYWVLETEIPLEIKVNAENGEVESARAVM